LFKPFLGWERVLGSVRALDLLDRSASPAGCEQARQAGVSSRKQRL
jgi:hypothetical protein